MTCPKVPPSSPSKEALRDDGFADDDERRRLEEMLRAGDSPVKVEFGDPTGRKPSKFAISSCFALSCTMASAKATLAASFVRISTDCLKGSEFCSKCSM